jgi:hypothetical protein
MVAEVVPLTVTVTPSSGLPDASVITPFMGAAAIAVTVSNSRTVRSADSFPRSRKRFKNKFIRRFFVNM